MKKIIALFLAVIMLLSLCACGGGSKTDVSGKVSHSDDTSSEKPGEEDKEEPANELDIGTVVGGVYENEFLGIGCELDSNWTYASKEELASLVNITADVFTDEQLKERLLDADMFYDMMAVSTDGLANMNIVIENMGLVYGTVIDEDAYIDLNLEQLPVQMTSAGMTEVKCEKTEITFAGRKTPAIYMTSVIQGMNCYQLVVPVKQGTYMACVALTSMFEDVTDAIADCFYHL